jgi:hypothetical protein
VSFFWLASTTKITARAFGRDLTRFDGLIGLHRVHRAGRFWAWPADPAANLRDIVYIGREPKPDRTPGAERLP